MCSAGKRGSAITFRTSLFTSFRSWYATWNYSKIIIIYSKCYQHLNRWIFITYNNYKIYCKNVFISKYILPEVPSSALLQIPPCSSGTHNRLYSPWGRLSAGLSTIQSRNPPWMSSQRAPLEGDPTTPSRPINKNIIMLYKKNPGRHFTGLWIYLRRNLIFHIKFR